MDRQQNLEEITNTAILSSAEEDDKEKKLKGSLVLLFSEIQKKYTELQSKISTLNKDNEQKILANFLNRQIIVSFRALTSESQKSDLTKKIEKITNKCKQTNNGYDELETLENIKKRRSLQGEISECIDNNFLAGQFKKLNGVLSGNGFKQKAESENETIRQKVAELDLNNWVHTISTSYDKYAQEQQEYWTYLSSRLPSYELSTTSSIRPNLRILATQSSETKKRPRLNDKASERETITTNEARAIFSPEESQTANTHSSKENFSIIESLFQDIMIFQRSLLKICELNAVAGIYYCSSSSTSFFITIQKFIEKLRLILDRLHGNQEEINSDNYLGDREEAIQNFSDHIFATFSLAQDIIILTKETTKGFIMICHDISSNLGKEEQWKKDIEQWIRKNEHSLEKITEEIEQRKNEINEGSSQFDNNKISQLDHLIGRIESAIDEQKIIANSLSLNYVGKQKKNITQLEKLQCETIKGIIKNSEKSIDYLKKKIAHIDYLDNIYENMRNKIILGKEVGEEEKLIEDAIEKDIEEFQKSIEYAIEDVIEKEREKFQKTQEELTSLGVRIEDSEAQMDVSSWNDTNSREPINTTRNRDLKKIEKKLLKLKIQKKNLLQRLQSQQTQFKQQTLIERNRLNQSLERLKIQSLQQQQEIIRLNELIGLEKTPEQIRLRDRKLFSQTIRENVTKQKLVEEQQKRLKNLKTFQILRENVITQRLVENQQKELKELEDKQQKEITRYKLKQLVRDKITDSEKKQFESQLAVAKKELSDIINKKKQENELDKSFSSPFKIIDGMFEKERTQDVSPSALTIYDQSFNLVNTTNNSNNLVNEVSQKKLTEQHERTSSLKIEKGLFFLIGGALVGITVVISIVVLKIFKKRKRYKKRPV